MIVGRKYQSDGQLGCPRGVHQWLWGHLHGSVVNGAKAVAALLGVSCPRGALSLVWSSAVQFVSWHSLHYCHAGGYVMK